MQTPSPIFLVLLTPTTNFTSLFISIILMTQSHTVDLQLCKLCKYRRLYDSRLLQNFKTYSVFKEKFLHLKKISTKLSMYVLTSSRYAFVKIRCNVVKQSNSQNALLVPHKFLASTYVNFPVTFQAVISFWEFLSKIIKRINQKKCLLL